MGSKVIQLLQLAKRNGVLIAVNQGDLQLKLLSNNIKPELLEELKKNKEDIIRFLSDKKLKSTRVRSAETEIQPFDRSLIKNVPLSFSQERLWFIDRLESNLLYHLP